MLWHPRCPVDIRCSFVRVLLVKLFILLGECVKLSQCPPRIDGKNFFLFGDITLSQCPDLGVDCIFQNSGVEGNDIENMLKRLGFFTALVDRMDGFFERAVFPDQLEGIRERGHKALL